MKHDKFTLKIFYRLWIPAIISSLGLSIADMADALVVGQRMGTTGLAAISLCLPIYMIINVIMHGFGLGGSVFFSKFMAEGNKEEAQQVYSDIMKAAIVIGLAFAVLGNVFINQVLVLLGAAKDNAMLYQTTKTYSQIVIAGIPLFFLNYITNYFLRNDNRQNIATLGFTIANVADLLLNILFVLVLNMGAAGAALSTILAQCIAFAIYLPALLNKQSFLKYKPGKIHWNNVGSCYRNGFSVSAQYIFQMIFLLIVNHVLIKTSGERGVAIFDLVQNVSYLIMYIYDASSKAMQPLLSTYCGECNADGIQNTKKLGLINGTICGGIVIILISLFPSAVCSLFGLDDPTTVALASSALRIYCLSALIGGWSSVIENYEQACEREANALTISFLRGTGVLIPVTVIFALFARHMLWWFYPVSEILALILYSLWRRIYGQPETLRSDKVFSYTITSSNQAISDLSVQASDFCEQSGVSMKKTYLCSMAVEEICAAIKEKAFEGNENGFMQATVVVLDDDEVEIHERDDAIHFNPFTLMSGLATEDNFDASAMGIMMVRKQAKDFFYRHYQGFNTLVVKL